MPDSIEDGLDDAEREEEEERGGARSRASSVRSAAGMTAMRRHWQNARVAVRSLLWLCKDLLIDMNMSGNADLTMSQI